MDRFKAPTFYEEQQAEYWFRACEEAYIDLLNETGLEPTDEEVEKRAEQILRESEVDYDAKAKDMFLED